MTDAINAESGYHAHPRSGGARPNIERRAATDRHNGLVSHWIAGKVKMIRIGWVDDAEANPLLRHQHCTGCKRGVCDRCHTDGTDGSVGLSVGDVCGKWHWKADRDRGASLQNQALAGRRSGCLPEQRHIGDSRVDGFDLGIDKWVGVSVGAVGGDNPGNFRGLRDDAHHGTGGKLLRERVAD